VCAFLALAAHACTGGGGGGDASTQLPDAGGELVREPTLDAADPDSADGTGDGSPAGDLGPAARPRGKVVLISIDGCRPDALFQAPAKNILALAARGSFSWQAQTINPSITLPSHSSMLSGYPPEVHGMLWNDWRPGYIPVPTVFSAAQAAGLRTVMVVGKEELQQLAIPGTVDTYVFAPGADENVVDNALVEVQRGFDLMFVHLPMVDYQGHLNNWMSDVQLQQVAETDRHVGRILNAISPDTTVIITADHGGHGYIHWSDLPEDYTIPWIAAGPGIRVGHQITQPVRTLDTAATVAHILDVRLRSDTIGRHVQEAFTK